MRQPPPPLRSAIIGAGMVGTVHARAVRRAGGQLAAVAASTPHRSQHLAAQLGAERAATAAQICRADDVDVVHVCTPNDLHPAQAGAALAAGKHVICEKPLATGVADAAGLAAMAEDTGLVAAVPFIYRFYPMVREARCRLADEVVWLMHGGYLQDSTARAAPGGWRADPARTGTSMTFTDIGSHWCDAMEFVTGHRIDAVFAMQGGAPGRGGRVDDGAVIAFRTDRGAIGTLVVSQVSPGRKNQLSFSFDGRRTAVRFDQQRPDELTVGALAADTLLSRDSAALDARSARYSLLPPGHPQGYQDCFDLFVADVYEAVATGTAPEGLPTFADGLRAAAIHAAVADSVASGAWTPVAAPARAAVAPDAAPGR